MCWRIWCGSIDPTDCEIVTLVLSLDPKDESVKALRFKNYCMMTTRYVMRMLPFLNIGEHQIDRRIRRLAQLGILDVLLRKIEGSVHQQRFVKPSQLYYQQKRKIEHRADRGLPSHAHEYSAFQGTRKVLSKAPDHLDDHKRECTPPLVAAGVPSQEKTPAPVSRTPEDEEAIACLAASLWASFREKDKEAMKR